MSGKRGRGRARLIFENTLSNILEKDYVRSTAKDIYVCMKRLMTGDDAKEVEL